MRICPFCGFDEGWTRDFEGGFRIECNVCGGAGPKSLTREGAEKKWEGYLKDLDTEGPKFNGPKFNAALAESTLDENVNLEGGSFMGRTFKSDEGVQVYFSDDGYIEFVPEGSDTYQYQFHGIPNPGDTIDTEGNVVEEDDYEENEPYLYLADFDDYFEVFVNGRVEYTIYFSELQEINEEAMGGVSAPMATLNNTTGVGNATPAGKAAMTGSQQNSSDAKGSGDKWDATLGTYTQDGKKKKKKKDTNENSISPFDEIGKMMAKRMKVPMYFEKGKDQSVKHVKQKNVEEGGSEDYTYHVATLSDFKGNKKKKK